MAKPAPDWGSTPEPSLTPFHFFTVADVEVKPIDWLWKPYIPRGVCSTLEGEGKMGKSFIAYAIAAAVSTGRPLPGEHVGREPANVLILSAEDDIARVVRPRLEAMGADLTRVNVSNEVKSLDPHVIKKLDLAVAANKAHLFIIDPILAYTGPKVDINKGNEVRTGIIGPLNGIADKHNIAVVLVRHFGKAKKDAKYQGLGSVDLTNAVRSQLQVRRWPDGSTALEHTASNYAKEGPPITYEVTEDGQFNWGTISEYPISNRPLPQRNNIQAWLREMLAAGPVPSAILEERAAERGFNWETVKKAKRGLASSYKIGDAWEWRLNE